MFTKKLQNCEEFTAGDGTILRELLHPDKADLNLSYSLAHAVLPPGITSLKHKLETSEVYYILSGNGKMHINNESKDVGPGEAIYIPPKSIQYLSNTGKGPILFLCIVDPAWKLEDETIF